MAGGSAELLTGHAVVVLRGGQVAARAADHRSTTIRFGSPSPAEIDAYLATGEPLLVAGGLTIDGYGGWFVEGVDGDPSSVIGISLPLTRQLLAEVGIAVVDLWRSSARRPAQEPARGACHGARDGASGRPDREPGNQPARDQQTPIQEGA